MQESDSEFVSKGPCGKCGSSDANAFYTDGHTHCFACSHTEQNGSGGGVPQVSGKRAAGLLSDISYVGLPARQITEETARRFGYGVTRYQGKPAQVAPYYDEDGKLVAQKVRLPGKDFRVVGDLKKALPFGAQAFPKTGKSIVVTEGEIDAMTMAQVQGLKWPCVSISCGADKPVNDEGEELPMTKMRRYFGMHRDYFLGFDKVVLMFDSDAQGVASAKVAAEIIGPTAHIAALPLKDANDMLLNGRVEELVNAMWRAKKHQPDGILSAADVRDKVMEGIPKGVPWPWPSLTDLTHGRRRKEVYTIGAGTGVGKSHLLLELVAQTIGELGEACGCIFLEQQPSETMLRLLGIQDGRPYHLPHGWDKDAVTVAYDRLERDCAPLFLYDHFGGAQWETIERRIRYLATVEGCVHIVLDHLTALAAAEDDERKALERIMKEVSELVTELNITLYLVSHLATPDGTPHEEGGRVMIRHFKGSRAIGFWSHYMIGLERDQQAEDRDVRLTTTVRLLKARYDGSKTGRCVTLKFDEDSNRLIEPGDLMLTGPADQSSPSDSEGDSDF